MTPRPQIPVAADSLPAATASPVELAPPVAPGGSRPAQSLLKAAERAGPTTSGTTAAASWDAPEAAVVPGTQARTFTLELPPGTPIISGNNRLDRYAKNRRIKDLQRLIRAKVRGRAQITVPVYITVEYASPPRLMRLRHPFASECILDHDNLWPTYKACCDGLVRAGLLAGDTKRYVGPGRVALADETHPRGLLRVTISEVTGGVT